MDKLTERYRQMPNEQLMLIALHEASGLTEEAQRVLFSELEARGLDPVVRRAVEAQIQPIAPHEVDALLKAVRIQPCPKCGQNDRLLNAGVIAEVKSFVFFASVDQNVVIACPACLAAQAKRAALKTSAFGWWAFPWGPIRSVQAIIHDVRTMRQHARDDTSKALREYVEQNLGVATVFAEGKLELRQ